VNNLASFPYLERLNSNEMNAVSEADLVHIAKELQLSKLAWIVATASVQCPQALRTISQSAPSRALAQAAIHFRHSGEADPVQYLIEATQAWAWRLADYHRQFGDPVPHYGIEDALYEEVGTIEISKHLEGVPSWD
jgi:hypothetical protein